MKNLFPGHYLPTPEFNEALPEALIVFDTNVLLNFYEWAPNTQAKSFAMLRKAKNQCWLPYHVALEFHRNRTGRVERTVKGHRDAIKKVTTAVNDVLRDIRAQDVFRQSPDTAGLLDALHTAGSALTTHLTSTLKALPQTSSDDPVNQFVGELFDGRVGPHPTQAKINEINDKGKKRYESKHPPGVTDANKEGFKYMDRETMYSGVYGDLYIWMQTLDHVATQDGKKHLIFVTDERKKDWWAKGEGGTPTPAPELVHELALHAAGWKLWMFGSPEFFQLLSAASGDELSAADLAEIEEAAVSTETGFDSLEDEAASKQPGNSYIRASVVRAYGNWVRRHHDRSAQAMVSFTPDGYEFDVPGTHRYVIYSVSPARQASHIDLLAAISNFHNTTRSHPLPTTFIIDTSSLDSEQRGQYLKRLHSFKSVFPDVFKFPSVYLGKISLNGAVRLLPLDELEV